MSLSYKTQNFVLFFQEFNYDFRANSTQLFVYLIGLQLWENCHFWGTIHHCTICWMELRFLLHVTYIIISTYPVPVRDYVTDIYPI